ncbi:acyltransferase family domain protein [Bacillus sp. OxB-1]|uniref:acyltransferase family protein n=1 Tax=Bacillus sp. (strain OxB-1) TaxID=98228 RepID=UPI0005822DA3|nr:acyltransferase family protein [Bacillus sp. OxB-1]BAQ11138.1 acyltransferase family domain protein [Bacillus sp. OxB-1]
MKDLKRTQKRYRPEIEGLRTITTVLIVIYHIWLGRVSGGIDVFFVLSGYLITMSLLSRMERAGRVRFGEYVGGLAKRLFPQALLVIIVIGILALLFLPQSEWNPIIAHMAASTLYFENWRLAFDAVDYLARDHAVSPFQHFWSLGVQGQFYILWPILITAVYILARKVLKTPVRKTFLSALFVVFICSIGYYSMYQTKVNQPWAYFDTFARMWEFSVGGMLALVLPYVFLNKWLNTVLGWLGLSIICLTGFLLPVSTVFPGYLALVPISGALLVLIASENSTKFGVDRLLSVKPLTFLGGLTYGIYLWHWPLLIFYKAVTDVETVPFIEGIVIILATVLLSLLSTKLLEAPILKLDKKQMNGKLAAVLCGLLVVAGSSILAITTYIEKVKADALVTGYDEKDYPGAKAVYENSEPPKGIAPIPAAIDIQSDLPSFYENPNCFAKNDVDVQKCSYGVVTDPGYTVALVGGSHSGHWFPALEVLAEDLNFRIDVYNHDGCRFTNEDPERHLTEACLQWNENLIEHLKEDSPDLVFTTSTLNKREMIPAGYINQWKELEGITTIFAVRDNPRMKKNIPSCLEKNNDPMRCAIPRDQGVSKEVPWEKTEGIPSNVVFADLTDYFCDQTTCHPIIGNIIVYRDNNHITATYAKTLALPLKEHLEQALGSL